LQLVALRNGVLAEVQQRLPSRSKAADRVKDLYRG
jgi:hypothetical protein